MNRHFLIILSVFSILFSANNALATNIFLNKFGGSSQPSLLKDEDAFQIIGSRIEEGDRGKELVVTWNSAEDYYLYRKNFKVISLHPHVKVNELILPKGELESDPLFGNVEVYFGELELRAALTFMKPISGDVAFNIHAQGCNKPVGICYPPQKRLISVDFSGVAESPINTDVGNSKNDPKKIKRSIWGHLAVAFGIGLLLVFTPCVLPMLPILSSMIVGQSASRIKAVSLSVAYVLGTAITYTAMGIAAGSAGIQLQAYFQQPIFIAVMVIVLMFLAASMFGLYELRLPSRLQTKLTSKTNKLSAGGFIVSLLVGMLSALIVSACVSPLLILVLGVAVQQADPVLGGAMMFFMALGMGVPLVLIGLGAHYLLPKAGAWMDKVKEFFGFSVLAVAILVASSIKAVPVLLLWAAWLLCVAVWLWFLSQGLAKKIAKIFFGVLAAAAFIWGTLNIAGGIYGGRDAFNPLNAAFNKQQEKVPFVVVTTKDGLNKALMKAQANNQPVLVDYYADWCVECVKMEKSTYRAPQVLKALERWVAIKVDVTDTNDASQAAKDRFSVFGPPATLFLASSGKELRHLHRYGYIKTKEFLSLIKEAGNAK